MPGILPIIIALGAITVIASKKKRKSSSGGEPDTAPGSGVGNPSLPRRPGDFSSGLSITAVLSPSGESNPMGELGDVCGPISERRNGIWSAYDKSGKCVIFWNADSATVMKSYILEELHKTGANKNKACAADVLEKDPFTGSDRWVPNPTKMKVLKNALKRAYPQIPTEQLPPNTSMPYYVHMIWKFSESIYMFEVCGYTQVT